MQWLHAATKSRGNPSLGPIKKQATMRPSTHWINFWQNWGLFHDVPRSSKAIHSSPFPGRNVSNCLSAHSMVWMGQDDLHVLRIVPSFLNFNPWCALGPSRFKFREMGRGVARIYCLGQGPLSHLFCWIFHVGVHGLGAKISHFKIILPMSHFAIMLPMSHFAIILFLESFHLGTTAVIGFIFDVFGRSNHFSI